MEAFVWGLAGSAVIGLAGIAIKWPFLFVRLGTALIPALGMAALAGISMLAGSLMSNPAKVGLTICLSAAAGIVYVILLGHLATQGLNARQDEETHRSRSIRDPQKQQERDGNG